MNLVYASIIGLVLLAFLFVINKTIKGKKGTIAKILSLVFVLSLFVMFIMVYGASIFDIFEVDVKSFSNLKAFFSSRILGVFALLLVYLFMFLKSVFVVIIPITTRTLNREEKAVVIASIVFDIAVIPNILTSGCAMHFLVALSLVEIGLTLTELVLFFFQKGKKELIYA